MVSRFLLVLVSGLICAIAIAQSDHPIVVTKAGSQPAVAAPPENFTGAVRIDSRFQAMGPGRVRGAAVAFEPGARTAWHMHPLGQTLIITSGVGWVQHWEGSIREVRPGDIVWIPPGVKHWHGATPTSAMSHIAIVETLNGKSVEWLERVSDEQYEARE